ncbi:hypothetical protein [Stutzerimonas stutzeri]|uniref:Sugar kinase n=1 Tax=Stutzerimonas stutzeri (strain A1501) TaxID=379731 RepID=A4VQ23_STUS1|nr:hypothetical protein [Stutzerimonas stutzeri]ABP81074.1 conserved hypothetical protein [Stutzerimonas stutzeri A1501]RRV84503.1 hypothetical protein EGI92_03590 [Stutzerimonas stutzeri]RRW49160.1 hypothetical protein EGJ42_13005 [Stutzerimonas stutzeri]UWG59844.1 hypothetical protein NDR94_17510 [Stutzerimonas stutzeri]
MYADVIDPVIKVLRETLRLARDFERPQKQVTTLQAVLRKLMVIRELHTTWFVSVAGTQGAGKTKLLCELYGLDGWLVDNSGRGEKRPLFIVESDCSEPYAIGITAEGGEEKIDRETLKAELDSFSHGMRYQLLRLYVPRQHFNLGFGFLLLPGYERKNSSNERWQEEMRDTLRHSMGSILVTDATRMADHATVGILDDLLNNCFANRSPIIAITWTEGKTDEERQVLRRTAAEVCRVDEPEMDRVVCTGVGALWREQWLPVFLASLKRYTNATSEVNRQRLSDLAAVVDDELEEAALMLEDLVGEAAIRVSGQELLLDGLMKKFRESAEKYRRGLERQLRERSQAYANLVTETARQQYIAEEEGLGNKMSNFFSGLMLNSSEVEQRFVSRVIRNWASQGARSPLEVTYLALSDMADRNLSLGYKSNRVPPATDLVQISSQGMPSLLGYENSAAAVKLFKEDVDNEQLQKSLRLLLQKTPSDIESLDQVRARSREVSTALELLPTLTMEFMRVAQAAILTVGANSLPELRQQPIEPEKVMEQIGKGLSEMVQSTKEIMSTILAISAVDIGLDGSLDVATVLTGGQVAGLGAQLSVAAAGIIALAYVGFKVSQAVHQYDTEKKNFIAFCVDHLASQQVEKTLQTYDDVIEQLQDRLTQNLSRAYGIDKELFSERDAMSRALYSLKIARRDLSVEIDRAQCHYLV